MSNSAQRIPWRRLIAEGVIIVFSILLAFLVDAWWGAAQDRSRERAYLSQLESDLEFTLENNAYFSARANARDRVEARLAQLYYEASLPPVDSISSWLGSIGYWVVQPRLGTAQTLISTGDLALIRNDSLRNAIPVYLTRMEAFEGFEDDGTRYYRESRSLLDQHVDRHRIQVELTRESERNSEPESDPFSSIPTGEMRALPNVDLLSAVQSSEVHRALIQMSEAKSMMRHYRDLMREDSEGLLALVDSVRSR